MNPAMVSTLDTTRWSSFASAAVGAGATLTGLLFVAVSINLDRLAAQPRLLARAAETLIGLVLALLICATLLIPQSARATAIEILVLAAATGIIVLRTQLRHGPDRAADPRWWFAVRLATVQAIAMLAVVGSIAVLLGFRDGAVVIAGGVLSTFAVAVYSAWVLLVEIVRKAPAEPATHERETSG